MAEDWAKSRQSSGRPGTATGRSDTAAETGPDLHLDIGEPGGRGAPGGARGVRASLVRALRDALRTGRLAPGTRLPSSRALAADLGIARNTVADAYGELVAEGRLTARRGAGTNVARRAEAPAPAAGRGGTGGSRIRSHVRLPTDPAHDLRAGSPDVSAFPRSAWSASARRALTAAPNDALRSNDLRGRIELRRALADYLARARGVRTDPERILICAGFVQGLSVVARLLPREAAVEEYGLPFHRDLLAGAGVRTRPLTVDACGARIDEISEHPAVRAALLTPAHQFPTGVPLHPDRRTAVVDWARRHDGVILEDDYDGEFRYDRRPVGALQSLDPERVVYFGTASKSLAPALRLAWVVLPERLVGPALEAKTPAEWTTGVLDQLTLADFLEHGAYDRHVRAMRQRYRRRRDRLVGALAERAPHVRVTGIAAGLHAILELPPGTDESAVLEKAARRGVALEGLAAFRQQTDPEHPATADAEGRPALVVGYGTPAEHAFNAALNALCDVLTPDTPQLY